MTLTVTGDDFIPLLLRGVGSLTPEEVSRLESYLRELCIVRGFPLNPVLCWNALCWDFDLERGQYADAPLEYLSEVRHGATIEALPVGAFIRVPVGRGHDEFWGEVVYKEGRSVPLNSSWVQPQFSGAPAAIVEEHGHYSSVLTEALIVDFDAISEPTGQSFERQRQRASVIDERHHLVVDARYDATDAELDDATYFARWMITHLRDPLIQGRFGAALSDAALADDDLLLSALIASITALREVMSQVPDCVMWRDYLFDLDAYDRRMTPDVNEPPLGSSDMAHLARMLTHLPTHSSVGYSSLGSLLVELGGGGADLNGPDWATAVCHASHFLIEWLAEKAPDGWLDSRDGTVHVRLDDAWLTGGIWRAERLTDGFSAYCAIPPEVPLGLGYAEASGALFVANEPEPEIVVTATQISMSVSLTIADVAQNRLRLDRGVLDTIADSIGEIVIARLGVEGLSLEPQVSAQATKVHRNPDEVASLWDLEWPYPFCAGSRVAVVWVRGSSALDVSLRRRTDPFVIGEFTYEYECDERLFARGNGIPEPPSSRGRTLRDLVLDVIRRRGDELSDGCRQVSFERVLVGVYGPDAPISAATSIRLTLQGLAAAGTLVEDGDLFVWCPGSSRATRVGDVDLSGYDDYLPRYVRLHDVRIYLRRLHASESATPERKRMYLEEWIREGRPLGLPSELPDGYTFVRPHERGTRFGESSSIGEE